MHQLRQCLPALAVAAGLLAGPAVSQAAIIADVVWVVDTSGSMADDIAQVKQHITEFDGAMLAKGIDVRYGLVAYGGAPQLRQDLTTFSIFNATGSPFRVLTNNGGSTEDGSLALQTAMGASFRADSVRNLILITDENDDNAGNRTTLDAALAATAARELINIIGNPADDDNSYYRTLAPANGGAFFNITDFRSNPQPFFTNFINTKVTEIVQDFCDRFPNDPTCTPTPAPEPGSLALVGLALAGLTGIRRQNRSVVTNRIQTSEPA